MGNSPQLRNAVLKGTAMNEYGRYETTTKPIGSLYNALTELL